MKETTLLVKEAHNALDRLQKHGAGIRDFVDRVVSGTAATYGFLEKSVSSENLEELRENEAKATAEIQKAKQVCSHRAGCEVVFAVKRGKFFAFN